ncbi:hypothetical protein MTR67_039820 [Solanum verrucosum]|uniref:Retrotransposon gag domain-containing protein n=1 Tax=Solanum verrucosum TaxID=315347 RepID=A0AAF0UHJ4_SOLVR|nr:hypothetical protein MTR67_039820 [Solanum verrucosum]
MADREIGMYPRVGTSRSPPSHRDRFPSKAHGGSPVPLVPASPTPIEARGDAVPLVSPVPLVPDEATNTGPPIPIVPPPEISGEQGIREAVQLLTRMPVELAYFRLRDVAILWYEEWERSRGPDAPPAEWEDFSEDFLAHYLPREVREARLEQFINLKQGTMSVRDYSHKFNSLARYAPNIVRTMRAKIHHYVDGLADHLIRDCRVPSLSDDVDISHIQAFAQITEDLSEQIHDTHRDREQSKMTHTIGSYMEPHGDFRPPFHRYPSLQLVVSHHKCRDRSLIVIVSQDQVRAQASLKVIDMIILYK